MLSRLIRRTAALLVFVTLSASAQAKQKCPKCDDEAAVRAARIEVLRTELARLVREARTDTTTVRLLNEALAKLTETETKLRQVERSKATTVYTTTPGSSSQFGYPSEAQMPQGYMGISLSGNTDVLPGRSELVVRYKDEPIIESVEPGSPAEEAGLASGDVIIAYNSEELKGRTISLTKLLKPGTKVIVKVRRNGSTKEIPVLVGRRAAYVAFERTAPVARGSGGLGVQPSFEWHLDTVETPTPPARTPVPARARVTAPPATTPEMLPPTLAVAGSSALAGAELTASNRQLGEYFGTSRGIVVLHVADGTPARRSGLRVGDVITSVDGDAVGRPAELQAALWRATSRKRVELEILRRAAAGEPAEKKTITLRW